jgi:hypothetical protein
MPDYNLDRAEIISDTSVAFDIPNSFNRCLSGGDHFAFFREKNVLCH